MVSEDWRSPAAYAYLTGLDAADLAFEFLRRNPDYRADFQEVSRQAAAGGEAEASGIRCAHRWGLAFPG